MNGCESLMQHPCRSRSVLSACFLDPVTIENRDTRKVKSEAGKEIALMRTRGLKWKKYAWPVVLAWFAWVAAECISSGTDNELTLYFLLGCGFGIIGAGICGTIYDRKRKAMLDTLLRQIDELVK